MFKFVINGDDWVVNQEYKIERDGSGIENNVVDEAELEVAPTATAAPSATAAPGATVVASTPTETSKAGPVTTAAAAPVASPPHVTAAKAAPATRPPTAASAAPATTTSPAAAPVPAPLPPQHLPGSGAQETAAAPAITAAPAKSATISPEPADSVSLPLTQVHTTESSFAGVSLPSQDGSAFEHLEETEEEYEEAQDDPEETNQFNTPTNSLFNLGVLATPNTLKTDPPARKGNVEILEAPGAFPVSATTNSSSNAPPLEKKDGLVSRFKNLFRY